MAASPPDIFVCPITMDIMRDPVNAPDGRTYERTFIIDALARRQVSPLTGEPMDASNLVTNYVLRQAIEEWCRENGVVLEQSQQTTTPTAGGSREAMAAEEDPTLAKAAEPLDLGAAAANFAAGPLKFDTVVLPGGKLLVELAGKNMLPEDRGALNVVVVLDTSGSMGLNATMAGSEMLALTLLDVVSHATNTVAALLDERDQFGLVTFASQASVQLPLGQVTPARREEIKIMLALTEPSGQTNLWAGIETGLEQLRNVQKEGPRREAAAAAAATAAAAASPHNVLIVLTDGDPNTRPALGEVCALNKYRREHADFDFTLMTMALGFDSNLASSLLSELAVIGHGAYTYIPDAGMVGTIFVNCISSLFSRVARDVEISISSASRPGMTARPLLPFAQQDPNTFQVPMVQAQQQQFILFSLDTPSVPPDLHVKVSYVAVAKGYDRTRRLNALHTWLGGPRPGQDPTESTLVRVSVHRSNLLLLLADVARGACRTADEFERRLQELRTCADAQIRDENNEKLLLDLGGEVTKAVTLPDAWRKWGVHYLHSLLAAHLLNICNNFKDPGVQVYKTPRFLEFQAAADSIFNSLPPPTPRSFKSGRGCQSQVGRQVQSMSVLNHVHNGCIHGDSLALMADGTRKKARNIHVGDRVMTVARDGELRNTVVQCVVETRCPTGRAALVTLPGEEGNSSLRVTPYHPVLSRAEGSSLAFAFPIDLVPSVTEQDCDAVFSFVLLRGATNIVFNGNVACISLGHGITDPAVDSVAAHSFFGNHDVVLRSLMQLPGWTKGHIVFGEGALLRDPVTGLACGFNATKAVDSAAAAAAAADLVLAVT